MLSKSRVCLSVRYVFCIHAGATKLVAMHDNAVEVVEVVEVYHDVSYDRGTAALSDQTIYGCGMELNCRACEKLDAPLCRSIRPKNSAFVPVVALSTGNI